MQMYCGERYQAPQGWEQTTGTPVGLRVTQSMPRGPRFYYGECLVEYKVGEKSYKIWAAAGLADRDMHYVADQLTACPIERYVVYYNPRKPADAMARRPEE